LAVARRFDTDLGDAAIVRSRAPDGLVGVFRAMLSRYLGGVPWLTGVVEHPSGRAAALPVDDQHDTRAMMREIVLAIMRCRS
jgi:hypothetical protein